MSSSGVGNPPVYLEYTGGSSDKFWGARQAGEIVEVVWGRRGTSGQKQIKTFPTHGHATAFVNKKKEEKRRKGYVETPAPTSWVVSNPPISPQPETNKFSGSPDLYGYLWETSGGEITRSALKTTADLVNDIFLDAIGESVVTIIESFDDKEGTVVFHSPVQVDEDIQFGYPTKNFYESLPESERQKMDANVMSTGGFLTPSGKGRGEINTEKTFHDISVRVFLSILSSKSPIKFWAHVPGDKEALGSKFKPRKNASEFAWSSWESQIIHSIRRKWILEDGDIAIYQDTSYAVKW